MLGNSIESMSCVLIKDRNDVATHKCVALLVVGERHESLQKMLPRNEVAGCLSVIARRGRHSESLRRKEGVPVCGGLHASNSCCAMKGADSKYVRPVRKVLRKRVFGGLSPFLCCLEKWSGLNRISHPHWVKIWDDHNGQISLRAKQKYEVLSATSWLIEKYKSVTLVLMQF